MNLSSSNTPENRAGVHRWEWRVAALCGIGFFAAFAVWGGLPNDSRISLFWLLVFVLVAISVGFALAAWHLLFRPLPAGHKTPTRASLPASLRRGLSVVLAIGGLSLVIGPFWDEIWHRQYGIPFGQDFFWRPHLLMYVGFGSGVVVGFWGLWYVMRHYKGTFQQRLRTNPLLGLLILSSAFLMYVLPADPIWHTVYGDDLSAWSIPHLLLFISLTFVMLMAAILYLSTQPRRSWQGIQKLRLNDVVPLLMFGGMILPTLQILTVDWDTAMIQPGLLVRQFRPDWLMVANIAFTGTFLGVIANRSLRYVGAATVSGLLALLIRFSLIQIFEVQSSMRFTSVVLTLAPLIAIDLWTAYQVMIRKQELSWMTTGIAAAVGTLVSIPLLLTFYPMITLNNLVGFVIAALVASLAASWLGIQIGEYAATQNREETEGVETPTNMRQPLFALGSLAVFLVFVVFFILTATPPV